MVVTPGRRPPGRAAGEARAWARRTGWSTSTSAATARRTWAGSGWRSCDGVHFVGFHPAPVGPAAEPARRPADRVDRGRPGGLGRRDGGQGRLRHGLRGDGRGDPADLPAPDRVRRAPGPRPRPPSLGRRRPAPRREFAELRLERHLERAFALEPGPPPSRPTGRRGWPGTCWRQSGAVSGRWSARAGCILTAHCQLPTDH